MQGQTNNTALVIENTDQLDRIDFSRPIYLFSQTTKSVEGFQALVKAIQNHPSLQGGEGVGSPIVPEVHDTICRNVANRVQQLRDFSRANDLVIFVGGTKSSNAKVLYRHCLEANPKTLFVSSPDEVDAPIAPYRSEMTNPDYRVGICGATSTPLWLMEQVRDRLLTANH